MVIKKFYGQWDQDKYLYKTFFKEYADNPFFVELGASDGIEFSNTYIFEKYLNWEGLLIEPQVEFFKSLIKNRPNSKCFNYAISTIDGEMEMIGFVHTSGLTRLMREGYRKFFSNIWPTASWVSNYKKDLNVRKVQSIPFYKILKNENISYIDLLCIDVEGAELEVLETFDWTIPVYIICIELVSNVMYPLSLKDQKFEKQIKEFLIAKGFKFNKRLGLDEIWMNNKNRRN